MVSVQEDPVETVRTYITATEVARAATRADKTVKAKAAGKDSPEADMLVYADLALKGLRLVVVNGVASWAIKTATRTKTLGYVYPRHDRPLTAPEKARELAGSVKTLLKTDPEAVDGYLAHRHAGRNHQDALDALRTRPDTWTFGECIEQMLTGRRRKGAKKRIKRSTEKDIRSTFNRSFLEELKATPAAILTRADFEKARDTIRKNTGISPAQKFVSWSRSVLSYVAEFHSGASGIDGKDRWWEMLHATHVVSPRTRNPEIEDIVKSLILAESYLDRPLPGRAIAADGVGAGVLAGLWWIVMTCQRGSAALALKTYNLFDDEERGGGWKLASWEADVMKAGRAQMLPIPPRSAAHIERIRQQAKHYGSKAWAFPSDLDPDKHASRSGTYRILYRLAARDALKPKAKKPPALKKDGTPRKTPQRTDRRDLLAEHDIAWWSGHDVRRRLQSVLDLAGIPGGTSVVLAHELKGNVDLDVNLTQQQREDYMRQRQARITAQAYGGAHFLKLKAEAMEVWTDALLDEYERQVAGKA